VALEVIGSGFGRTGTQSIKLALEQLGFGPCHHMDEVFQNPTQVPHWQALASGEKVDWNTVFKGYRSQVDWPGAHVWRELAAAYPDAKVLHSIRPEEAWWRSFSDTIATALTTYRDAPTPPPPHMLDMFGAVEKLIMRGTFGDPPIARETAIAAFRARTEAVRESIPPERLLMFDVTEGWEPLCAFLGVPVPETPFPRTNSTEQFWQLVRGGAH
jgi:hypothetical protein